MRTHTSMLPTHSTFLIIGGGPAGSTAAAILAREGLEVTLLEKEVFPRYHIGESLLTSLLPVLEFVGAYEKIASHGFVKKPGAYFALKQDLPPGHVDFSQRGAYTHSFQVIRSEFDEILLEHASSQGANVYEDTAVRQIAFEGGRPHALTYEHGPAKETGTIKFDYLIDASGLNGILATKYLKNRVYQETFANVAVGSYWKNYAPYKAEEPGAFFCEAIADGRGWIWAIPVHDGTLSLGAVIHKSTLKDLRARLPSDEDILADCIDGTPTIKRMLASAERVGSVRVWQDYSYCASSFAGDNYRLIGDAAGFIDPLYSTGVHLAMLGALSSSASLVAAQKGMDPARAAKYHDFFIRRTYTRYVLLVSGAYRQIRNQSEVIFGGDRNAPAYTGQAPEVNPDVFRMMFPKIQPILSGDIDVDDVNDEGNKIPKEVVSEAMDFVTNFAFQRGGWDTKNDVSKLLKDTPAPKVGADDVTGGTDPVDGLRIHMERGHLGLVAAKVG